MQCFVFGLFLPPSSPLLSSGGRGLSLGKRSLQMLRTLWDTNTWRTERGLVVLFIDMSFLLLWPGTEAGQSAQDDKLSITAWLSGTSKLHFTSIVWMTVSSILLVFKWNICLGLVWCGMSNTKLFFPQKTCFKRCLNRSWEEVIFIPIHSTIFCKIQYLFYLAETDQCNSIVSQCLLCSVLYLCLILKDNLAVGLTWQREIFKLSGIKANMQSVPLYSLFALPSVSLSMVRIAPRRNTWAAAPIKQSPLCGRYSGMWFGLQIPKR